jgi:hypothetical protein
MNSVPIFDYWGIQFTLGDNTSEYDNDDQNGHESTEDIGAMADNRPIQPPSELIAFIRHALDYPQWTKPDELILNPWDYEAIQGRIVDTE